MFWVGDVARQRGKSTKAEAYYREYKRLADEMVAIQPDNLKWRMEVAYANHNIGIVLLNQRRFAEAVRGFESAIKTMESAVSLDPGDDEYQSALGNALGWLADSQKALGNIDAAIAIRQRQVAFLDRQVARGASDVSIDERLIPAHQGLGVLFTSRGEVERGIDEYRLALGQANRLIGVEPHNSLWKDYAANVHLYLAQNLLSAGRQDDATQEAAAGCNMAVSLQARDRDVARWGRLRTLSS